jgi:hypothetical protein
LPESGERFGVPHDLFEEWTQLEQADESSVTSSIARTVRFVET